MAAASHTDPPSASSPVEQAFPSTRWAWKYVKVGRPPEAKVTAARRATFWRRHRPTDPRKPTGLTLRLRGGAECWVEIHSRAAIGRYPGNTAIIDILRDINNVR